MTDLEKRADEYITKKADEGDYDYVICNKVGFLESSVKRALADFAQSETELLSKHILELQADKGKLIDENHKLKLDRECSHCIYSDSPCTPADYDKKDNCYCSHYKNVFDENRKLTDENKELKDLLKSVVQIINRMTPSHYLLEDRMEVEIVNRAEQFLGDEK